MLQGIREKSLVFSGYEKCCPKSFVLCCDMYNQCPGMRTESNHQCELLTDLQTLTPTLAISDRKGQEAFKNIVECNADQLRSLSPHVAEADH